MNRRHDITLYHKVSDRKWNRIILKGNWQSELKTSISDRGLVYASKTTVFIPASSNDVIPITVGDVLIKGICDLGTDSSAKDLLTHSNSIEVIAVIDNRFQRGLSHLEVIGK